MSTQDPSDLWSRSDGEAELLQDLGWYHSNLTRHAAEALLLSNGCDGSYLLRDSNERTGLYSLSVRAKDSVKHFHVEYTGYSFKFGFNEFSSLKDFVKHFANQPLIGSETGTLIVLKHPYPRKVEEPSIYESVRVHTAMQTGRTENDLVPTAPSMPTQSDPALKLDTPPPLFEQKLSSPCQASMPHTKLLPLPSSPQMPSVPS
ncbi:dual adapter for phosphotyrosine and 3-phosphotyrosine and 3-phosphoinositide [Camelus ferus]|nr:dual adapter for phosphotyrosine and 3-phosphotyrosine and 3-phosphoinositide [Camelus ferus]